MMSNNKSHPFNLEMTEKEMSTHVKLLVRVIFTLPTVLPQASSEEH